MAKTAFIEGRGGATRRRRSKLERRRIVEETLIPGATVAEIARHHRVNANQVHGWRKLYRQGRLDTAPPEATLVPVRVFDPSPQPSAGRRVSGGMTVPGTIYIECGRGRLCIEGAADPLSLRVALECLTR